MEQIFGKNKQLILILLLSVVIYSCKDSKDVPVMYTNTVKTRKLYLDARIQNKVRNFSKNLDTITSSKQTRSNYALTFFTYKNKDFLEIRHVDVNQTNNMAGVQILEKDTVYVFSDSISPKRISKWVKISIDSVSYSYKREIGFSCDPLGRCYLIENDSLRFLGNFNCYIDDRDIDQQLERLKNGEITKER